MHFQSSFLFTQIHGFGDRVGVVIAGNLFVIGVEDRVRTEFIFSPLSGFRAEKYGDECGDDQEDEAKSQLAENSEATAPQRKADEQLNPLHAQHDDKQWAYKSLFIQFSCFTNDL